MASTTLNTFLLQAPLSVYSVDLLGSWDSFSRPYKLKRDLRTGPGHWRGCHTFENITFDGDTLTASASRDGGLKMGGTYWYYYLLDGDMEYHNPAEPTTRSCPLLPGQIVNVLDVPIQAAVPSEFNASSTSVDSLTFTLDPKDRYLPPGVRRAATTSAIQNRKALPASPRIVHRAATSQMESITAASKASTASRTGQSTLERQHSLLSIFHRLRQTRSAGSNSNSGVAWPRKLFSRTGQSEQQYKAIATSDELRLSDLTLESPPSAATGCGPAAQWSPSEGNTTIATSLDPIVSTPSDPHGLSMDKHLLINPVSRSSASHRQYPDIHFTTSEVDLSSHAFKDEHLRAPNMRPDQESAANPHRSFMSSMDAIGLENTVVDPQAFSTDMTPSAAYATSFEEAESHDYDPQSTSDFAESRTYSYAQSDNFSPSFASNTTQSGHMSPLHLSQPDTPLISDFEDDLLPTDHDSIPFAQLVLGEGNVPEHAVLRPPSGAPPPPPSGNESQKPHLAFGGFQGYSLPGTDQASTLTVQKIPSNPFLPPDAGPTIYQQSGKQDFANPWKVASEQQLTGFESLVEDLGYLSELII